MMEIQQSPENANQSPRWQQRFMQFRSALATLEEVLPRAGELNTLEEDGLLQRFEFTFEIAWKVTQDYVHHLGQTHVKGPRPVLAEMTHNNLLDPFLWNEMLTARNTLTNLYNEQESRRYVQAIVQNYVSTFQEFRQTMQQIQEQNVP
jgi:nucleotidyltransferase substrate binding protein (TIGR01987 family)